MRKTFDLLSGMVFILAALFSVILIRNQQLCKCMVIGGNWFNYVVVYLIVVALTILGVALIIQALRK